MDSQDIKKKDYEESVVYTNEKYNEEYLQNKAANIPDDIIKKGIFVKNIDEKIKLYDKTWASIK